MGGLVAQRVKRDTTPILERLKPQRWAIVSAWMKSMRLSRPHDAAYYLELVFRVDPPFKIYERLFKSAAEDSCSVWCLVEGLRLFGDFLEKNSTDKELKHRARLLTIEMARQGTTYNLGKRGRAFDLTKVKQSRSVTRLPLKALRKLVMRPEHVNVRQEWVRTWQLTDAIWDKVEADLEFFAIQSEILAARAELHPHKFVLEELAKWHRAYEQVIVRHDENNWTLRPLFLVIIGGIGSRDSLPEIEAKRIIRKARRLVRKHLSQAERAIVIPTYAYDGRHVRSTEGITDRRFAGDGKGMSNMFAMSRRDGALKIRKQAALASHRVPPAYLDHPFMTIHL